MAAIPSSAACSFGIKSSASRCPIRRPTFPRVSGTDSVRQAYEKFTSPPLCQGCHVRINPVGFLFENYDTLGAYRTVDDNGRPVKAAGTVVGAVTSNGN